MRPLQKNVIKMKPQQEATCRFVSSKLSRNMQIRQISRLMLEFKKRTSVNFFLHQVSSQMLFSHRVCVFVCVFSLAVKSVLNVVRLQTKITGVKKLNYWCKNVLR